MRAVNGDRGEPAAAEPGRRSGLPGDRCAGRARCASPSPESAGAPSPSRSIRATSRCPSWAPPRSGRKFHEPSASFWGAEVDLKPGATVEQLRRQVEADAPSRATRPSPSRRSASTRQQVDRAVGPQVAALWVFAAIAAFVALMVVGQAVSRRLAADGVDNPTLDAMGMSHRDRFVASMSRRGDRRGSAVRSVAVLITFLLSPIAPIGPARLAETVPRVRRRLVGAAPRRRSASRSSRARWGCGRRGGTSRVFAVGRRSRGRRVSALARGERRIDRGDDRGAVRARARNRGRDRSRRAPR